MAILTVQLFNQYCDDYFLANQNKTNILNGAIKNRLPVIITNTETALNAMLNGRLYKTYPSNGNITFKGVGELSAQDEQTTLYSALTEAVLYKIQTGAFVNLKNNYNGNITGSNNFDTSNSNVIGLRNDIRDKLVMLQLYKSATFTNPTVQATIQPQNQPLTVQQSTQISNWLSTNNFTLGGSWNFANLNVDGTPISQYISNQLSTVDKGISTVLINYLPSTEIPLITSKDIQKWNNAQSVNLETINSSIASLTNTVATTNKNMTTFSQQMETVLSPYVNGSNLLTIPLITSTDITKWNNPPTVDLEPWVRRFEDIGEELETINSILTNYNSNNPVPIITSTDISNWNSTLNVSTILSNYINIPNQTQQALVPYITQADIDKWNSNSGSSSGSSSVSIKEQIFTLTITNTWEVQYSNGILNYQGSILNVSPNLPSGLNISVNSVNDSLNTAEAYINVSVSGKTIISSQVYPYTLTYSNGTQYVLSDIQQIPLSSVDNITFSISQPIEELGSWQSNLSVLTPYVGWWTNTGNYTNPFPLDYNNSFCIYTQYSVGASSSPTAYPANNTIQENMNVYLRLVYIE